MAIATILLQIGVYAQNKYLSSGNMRDYSPRNTLDEDSLTDASIFQIDDSLLTLAYPAAKIKPLHISAPTGDFSHSQKLHFTPNASSYPNYLIIVNAAIYDSISYEVKRYAEDVHAIYGYGVYVEIVNNDTPEQLKSIILQYQSNLCGVIFVGDLSHCLFEIDNDYGHTNKSYGYKKWPCELYFMDLNGNWADVDNNGIYDSHTGSVGAEIYVARLTAYGLNTIGSEASLLRAQFAKSHSYWWNTNYQSADTVLNYIDKDWNTSFPSYQVSQVFASGGVDDIRKGIDTVFSRADYLNRLEMGKYGFTHLASHSSPSLHQFSTWENIYASSLVNNTSSNFAYNLFCCSACLWTVNSTYLGGAYLFNNGKTLAVIGSTKIGSMLGTNKFYNQFPTKNLGDAYKYWWNNYHNTSFHSRSAISWSYGMCILGDPTINFRHSVSDYCESNLVLTSFPSENESNLVIYKAGESITVGDGFAIPIGVHVVFDAPKVIFSNGFVCPRGATYETRNEGCIL